MSGDQSKWMKAWNRFRAEAAAIARVTFGHMKKLVRLASDTYRERRLRKESDSKREALGQSLFDAGVGSNELRQQFHDLQERITSVEAASGSTKLLSTERRGLLLRLADEYLNKPPTPGASREPTAVFDARQGVDGAVHEHETHRTKLIQARAELSVLDAVEKRRVLIGYCMTAVVVALVFSILFRSSDSKTSDSQPKGDDHQETEVRGSEDVA